ncbi:MAG: metallophosphoesterase [Alphaproteobacteria bacterium]|nr:metallophosphoesterase [Alphaproteobacteria bacterium]
MQWDIIPDIHGQSEKLKRRLTALGYQPRNNVWCHADADRKAVFLGDFIDQGPDNTGVINIVRNMVDAGHAHAIMGNHELNAFYFHTLDPNSGAPLREHSTKNRNQHASFLAEFPLGRTQTRDVINWMRRLPLFLEFGDFRVVHACWNDSLIEQLKSAAPTGVLHRDDLIRAADDENALFTAVETTTKGPEAMLPDGCSFVDTGGTRRTKTRLKWWAENAVTWRDISVSVPDPMEIPATVLPHKLASTTYPSDAKPVFFGHYWMSGKPVLLAKNALCLDYSAGREGPLLSYDMRPGSQAISLNNIGGYSDALT